MDAAQIERSPPNRRILEYLRQETSRRKSESVARDDLVRSPESVADPYLTLGTHPEPVEFLWKTVVALVETDCRWVIYGRPALVRPDSGVIFGIAEGTHTCALRFPIDQHFPAMDAGAKNLWQYPAYPALDIEASEWRSESLGSDWLFCFGIKNPEQWGALAYDSAARHK